jgi:peptide/nickel transport system substrate-binding protein
MYLLGWNADFADPDNFIYTFFGPMAVHRYGWNDPQVVAMATKARELPSQDARAKLYAQILTTVHQQVPMIALIHATNIDAIRKGVTGFVPNPLGAVPHMDAVAKTE